MSIVRLIHAKRMILCLGLVGMLHVASGCGQDYTTAPQATAEQKAKMDKMKETMKSARGQAIEEGKKSAGNRR